MAKKEIKSVKDVAVYEVDRERRLYSAEHDEILAGLTTDIYFIKTNDLLKYLGKENTVVTAEVFARQSGVLAGVSETLRLMEHLSVEVWALPEGEAFSEKEVLMRIRGPYCEFGIYETALLGILASSSGWATAAREARLAAGDCPMLCFGARHVHPAVAPVMERAALIGGADGASCIMGAKLGGKEPSGTMPHAAIIIVGDTVETAIAYHQCMPPDQARIVLVDTFKDEVEETLRVAEALGQHLQGVRLDTPRERGGVTPDLVREVRWHLDQMGYEHVRVLVSGGLTPEKIRALREAGAAAFGVGSYISGAVPIDMTMDLKEVEGKPIAKRGRIPGCVDNPRLKRMK